MIINKGSRLLNIGVVLWSVVSLSACSFFSTEIKQFPDSLLSNSKLLSKKQTESLDTLEQFVLTTKSRERDLLREVHNLCMKWVKAERQVIVAKAAAHETQIYAKFEAGAWHLMTEEFPLALDDLYWGPIREIGKKEKTKRDQLAAQVRQFPNDAGLMAKYQKVRFQVKSLSETGLRDEIALRERLTDRLNAARQEVKTHAANEFAKFRQQAAELGKKACADLKAEQNVYQDAVTKIEGLRDQLNELHSQQIEAIITLKAYFNQPEIPQLLLQGAGAELKRKISLSGLPFADKVTSFVDFGMEKLQPLLDETASKANSFISNKLNSLSKDVQKSASSMVKNSAAGLTKGRRVGG